MHISIYTGSIINMPHSEEEFLIFIHHLALVLMKCKNLILLKVIENKTDSLLKHFNKISCFIISFKKLRNV